MSRADDWEDLNTQLLDAVEELAAMRTEAREAARDREAMCLNAKLSGVRLALGCMSLYPLQPALV